MQFIILYQNIFSVFYFLYSLLIILLVSKIIKSFDNNQLFESSLTEEEYFVLSNKYNIEKIFYYITYKLYAKGVLLKNRNEINFYVNNHNTENLSSIEQDVYNLYLNKFSPANFKIEMINENIFKEYYYSVYNNLKSNNFIKDSKIIIKSKLIFYFGLLLVFSPGIYGVIYGYKNNILLFNLFSITIILNILYIFILKNKVFNYLTNKAKSSKIAFKNNCSSLVNSLENNNYIYTMNQFLIENSWMHFLGLTDDINDDDVNDNSGD